MPSETTTPNVGLQVPAFDQANWQVPTNFNWNLLDLLLSGAIELPALWVSVLTAGNISGLVLPPRAVEVPAGDIPGSTYTLSATPNPANSLDFYVGGLIQRYGLDYTLTANIVALNTPTSPGVTIYATYYHS